MNLDQKCQADIKFSRAVDRLSHGLLLYKLVYVALTQYYCLDIIRSTSQCHNIKSDFERSLSERNSMNYIKTKESKNREL